MKIDYTLAVYTDKFRNRIVEYVTSEDEWLVESLGDILANNYHCAQNTGISLAHSEQLARNFQSGEIKFSTFDDGYTVNHTAHRATAVQLIRMIYDKKNARAAGKLYCGCLHTGLI